MLESIKKIRKSNGCFKSYTYSELLNFYILIFSHCEEAFQMEIIQQHVDRDSSYGCINNFFEYVDISEHVHHNGNDLRGQSDQILISSVVIVHFTSASLHFFTQHLWKWMVNVSLTDKTRQINISNIPI